MIATCLAVMAGQGYAYHLPMPAVLRHVRQAPPLHGHATRLAHGTRPPHGTRRALLAPRAGAAAAVAAAAGGGDGELLFAATSAHGNGDIQVREMVQGGADDGALVRALWFSSSPGVWQSAVAMRRDGGGAAVPDWSASLPFPSSRAHAFATALVEQPGYARTAMVMGLGAGTLAGWLLQTLPSLTELSCSELDPQVRDIATSYFGLDDQDPRLTLQVGDALGHAAAAQAAGKTFDLVVVDVGGAQDVESQAMMAPPVAFQTREALRLAADLVAPGGVLSMTVVGGGDQELLQLLEHLEHALEETSGPGGHVCYLESRAAERWLRSSSASVPSRIIYALKHVAPSANGVRDAPPRGFLRARASVFDAELGAVSGPGAAAAGFGSMSSMLQRVQVELNDVQGLRRRIQQTAVFASLSPSLASPSEPPPAAPTPGSAGTGWYKEKQRAEGGTGSSDAAASSAYEAQLRVFRQNQPLQAGPPDQAAQGRWESAKQQQKWVYAQNNPGVADLDALRAAPPPQEKTEDRDRQEKTQDRGQPATTHDARSRQLLDPDEELQVSAEDEAALLEELTEFRRRQSSGQCWCHSVCRVLLQCLPRRSAVQSQPIRPIARQKSHIIVCTPNLTFFKTGVSSGSWRWLSGSCGLW